MGEQRVKASGGMYPDNYDDSLGEEDTGDASFVDDDDDDEDINLSAAGPISASIVGSLRKERQKHKQESDLNVIRSSNAREKLMQAREKLALAGVPLSLSDSALKTRKSKNSSRITDSQKKAQSRVRSSNKKRSDMLNERRKVRVRNYNKR